MPELPIRYGRFIDSEGIEQKVIFIGSEKAIYDENGKRLDNKLLEMKKSANLSAKDTEGLVVTAGEDSTIQLLLDAVADKIVNQLVTNSALTAQLANYVTKAMMSGVQVNDADHIPTSALVYAMQQAITQLNGDRRIRTYTAMSQIGLDNDATLDDVLTAMPPNSVLLIENATTLTSPTWNFPAGLYYLRVERTTTGRASLSLFGKQRADGDYRMFLGGSGNTNSPSGRWFEQMPVFGVSVTLTFNNGVATYQNDEFLGRSFALAQRAYAAVQSVYIAYCKLDYSSGTVTVVSNDGTYNNTMTCIIFAI